MNLILALNGLGKVHTKKLSSINLFQRVGFGGLAASSCLIDVSHAYDCESYCNLGTHNRCRVFVRNVCHET